MLLLPTTHFTATCKLFIYNDLLKIGWKIGMTGGKNTKFLNRDVVFVRVMGRVSWRWQWNRIWSRVRARGRQGAITTSSREPKSSFGGSLTAVPISHYMQLFTKSYKLFLSLHKQVNFFKYSSKAHSLQKGSSFLIVFQMISEKAEKVCFSFSSTWEKALQENLKRRKLVKLETF